MHLKPCLSSLPRAGTTGRHIVALLGLALLTSGCSQDKHTYLSTIDRPTTVTLVDPLGDQQLWVKDIPVGHKLVVDLDRKGENELASISGDPATHLTWSLYGPSGHGSIDGETIVLPGVPVLLKVTYRKSPEYPPGQGPTEH